MRFCVPQGQLTKQYTKRHKEADRERERDHNTPTDKTHNFSTYSGEDLKLMSDVGPQNVNGGCRVFIIIYMWPHVDGSDGEVSRIPRSN